MKSGQLQHKEEYKQKKWHVDQLLKEAIYHYYKAQLYKCTQKSMSNTVCVLVNKKVRVLPLCTSAVILCNKFSKFQKIRDNLDEMVVYNDAEQESGG